MKHLLQQANTGVRDYNPDSMNKGGTQNTKVKNIVFKLFELSPQQIKKATVL